MNEVTEQTRHYTASAVVLDPDRGVVLLVHHIGTGRWQFPGGHVDPDEDGAECALREVAEETGVTATLRGRGPALKVPGGRWLPRPAMVVEFPAPATPGMGEPAHAHLDMLYVATADSAAPVTAQLDETHGARWWPIEDVDGEQVRPDVAAVLAHLGELTRPSAKAGRP